jgi:CHAT domain-containing protein
MDAAATSADHAAERGRERHRRAKELETLLKRIRSTGGFATFGPPPTLDELLSEAAHGPVVTYNISSHRSDALLLTRNGITSCPLPQLTQEVVVEQVNTFYQALAEATAPDADRISAQQTLRQILEWLWEAATEPALSALAALGEAIPAWDGEPLPRVWWAPGGLLGMLPLHAAGFHTDPGHGPHRRTVLDRVISSYTPTIRALRHARQPRSQPADASQSLIIAMPTTPGLNPLPYVHEEVRRLLALLPRPVQLIEPEPDNAALPPGADAPTAAAVLARLPECSIAHFTCHGASNRADPSQSLLFLHDHATTPLTVSALARVNLDRAQLAYLSACSTADPGSSRLFDEAIHLTSAFQLAGFPHVVGTLWPVDDHLSAKIAESFYTNLTTGPPGTLDPNRAATALHHAVRAVRDRYPATPSLWAAYLHVGA